MHNEQLPGFSFPCISPRLPLSPPISSGPELNVIFMNTSWPGRLLGFELILLASSESLRLLFICFGRRQSVCQEQRASVVLHQLEVNPTQPDTWRRLPWAGKRREEG